jgi:Restriction endonuclease
MSGTFDIAVAWDGSWKVNGQKPKRQIKKYLGKSFDTGTGHLDLNLAPACPYCAHKLRHKSHKQYEGKDNKYIKLEDEPDGEILFRHHVLSTCSYCSHWIMSGYEAGTACMDPTILLTAASVTAKFATSSPHGCSEELAQHLRRKPELWHQLSPYRMETLVADIFKANYQHCEVKHVGGPGDLGIDVLFVDDNEKKRLIQVKRREKPNKAEGFSTLQSILGTMALHGERHGIIVSTADSFSFQAKREVKNAAKQGYLVELVDKGVLNRMVGKLLPHSPWRDLFSHSDASIIKDLKSNFTKFHHDTIAVGYVRDTDAESINDLFEEPRYVDPNQLSLF